MNLSRGRFIVNLSLTLFLATAQLGFALADDKVTWEPRPDIASTSLRLKGNTIQVVVKNTSVSPKELFRLWEQEFVILDYIDENGKFMPLGYHPDPEGQDDGRGSGALTTPLSSDGETFNITLNPKELSEIRTQTVVCRFVVFDRSTKEKYHLQSKPQLVVSPP